MKRYFFHLDSEEGRVEDKEGELLSGLEEALQAARQTASELSRNIDYPKLIGMSVGVRDESGRLLYEFALADSLHLEPYGSRKRGGSRFHY